MNGKHVSEEKTKTDLIQRFITSEKIMSEKENSLLDLRNVVENINLIHLLVISNNAFRCFLYAGSIFGPERYLKEIIK